MTGFRTKLILKRALYNLLVTALAVAWVIPQLASAETKLDVELAAGYAWDDNVGLDELERATGESDEVTSLEIQGSAEFSFDDRASVRISAGLVDDSYQKFSISPDGALSFLEAPDFEEKDSYVVAIGVANELLITSFDIEISVTNYAFSYEAKDTLLSLGYNVPSTNG